MTNPSRIAYVTVWMWCECTLQVYLYVTHSHWETLTLWWLIVNRVAGRLGWFGTEREEGHIWIIWGRVNTQCDITLHKHAFIYVLSFILILLTVADDSTQRISFKVKLNVHVLSLWINTRAQKLLLNSHSSFSMTMNCFSNLAHEFCSTHT